MEIKKAASILASLAQLSRLRVFRILVGAPERGLCAGEISKRLKIPKPTLSFHLKELINAGIVVSRREGRSLFYEICGSRVQQLMGFLTEDCCQGRPELCLPKPIAACCETAQ